MPEDRERDSSLEPATAAQTAAQTIEGASTGAIWSARYWFAPHKKVFEKPGLRLAFGAAALLPFVLFLLSNLFQLRGFVDLTASRIDLGLAVILLLALVYVFAFNLCLREDIRQLRSAACWCL
jgi:hypothetical protein